MNRRRNFVVVGAVVTVLVGMLAFGAFAIAQEQPSAAPGTEDGPGWGGPGGHGRFGHGPFGGPDPAEFQQKRTELATDLGAQLGRSPQDVEAAFRGVVEQRLNEAADAGRIDRAQIPAALTAYDEGNVREAFQILHD